MKNWWLWLLLLWCSPAFGSFTPTSTNTQTQTATNTPTQTATTTFSNTATATATNTATNTWTNTPTNTASNTATYSPTSTPTQTATNTFNHTATFTNTPTMTATNTATNTPTIGPVEIFGSAAATVIAAGSAGQKEFSLDLSGRHIFFPYAPIGSWRTASAAVSTATTVQLIAKSGALNNTILGGKMTSTSASLTNGTITCFLVAGASTTIWTGEIDTGTSIFTPPNVSIDFPIECGNNPVSLVTSAAVTSVLFQVSYTQDN